MTVAEILGLVGALLLMSLGVVGCLVPGLPSTPLILIAALLHKAYFGPTGASWIVLALLLGMTLLSLVMDYLATVYGAKKLGATWRGMWGAVLGGLLGLFFSLPGILLGPFLGATLFELFGGRSWDASARAGLGAMIGIVAGAIGKTLFCLLMMTVFTVNVVYRSV